MTIVMGVITVTIDDDALFAETVTLDRRRVRVILLRCMNRVNQDLEIDGFLGLAVQRANVGVRPEP